MDLKEISKVTFDDICNVFAKNKIIKKIVPQLLDLIENPYKKRIKNIALGLKYDFNNNYQYEQILYVVIIYYLKMEDNIYKHSIESQNNIISKLLNVDVQDIKNIRKLIFKNFINKLNYLFI